MALSARGVLGLIVVSALACSTMPAATSAAGKFDGVYTGTATLLPGPTTGNCRTFSTSISITNNRLTYTHGGNTAVVKTGIAADGSFSSSVPRMWTGPRTTPQALDLTGKVIGNKIEADASSSFCKFHLSLTKKP